MQPFTKAKRIRIYISSTDKFKQSPLYELIVYTAKEKGITGATVFKGIMGFGTSSEVYNKKLWEITEKVPLIVEIVDESDKIDTFFESIKPYFEKVGKGLIITVDETIVIMHKAGTIKTTT